MNSSMQGAGPGYAVLIGEFLILFMALPVAFRFRIFPFPPIPALWILAAYCLWRLLRDPAFDRRLLWNPQTLPQNLASMALIFAVVAALVWAGVYYFRPDLMFNFVRRAPLLWALVMGVLSDRVGVSAGNYLSRISVSPLSNVIP